MMKPIRLFVNFVLTVVVLFLIGNPSYIHADKLFDRYKELMNGHSNLDEQETSSSNNSSWDDVFEKVRVINSQKKGTFESSSDFRKRKKQDIKLLEVDIENQALSYNMNYLAGTITMVTYDADQELLAGKINWDENLALLVPSINIKSKINVNISRRYAKLIFDKKKSQPLFITLKWNKDTFIKNKLFMQDGEGGTFLIYDSTKMNSDTSLELFEDFNKKNSYSKNLKIPYEYEAAGIFQLGTSPVKVKSKWGLIDKENNWVIPPKYFDVGKYSEGKMAVKLNGKYGFINSKGRLLTSFSYKKPRPFSEGLAGIRTRSKWGFIDKNERLRIDKRFNNVKEFKGGYAAVQQGEKWGYINKVGKWQIAAQYELAYNFNDGLAVVIINKKRGYINKQGKFEIPPLYRKALKFSEGFAPVSNKKGQWYFVDKKNILQFNKTFRGVKSFSENMSPVMNLENKWGYIDNNGSLIIDYQFDTAFAFQDGLALVTKKDKRGFINKKGVVIIPLIYDDAYQFREGLAPVKRGMLWGYITKP